MPAVACPPREQPGPGPQLVAAEGNLANYLTDELRYPGMARTTDPRTRPALLAAARELFYGHGVRATTVDDIAAASGLTKPTVYRHFPTKELLVSAYLDERASQLHSELRERVESVPPEHRPEAVVDWLCDWVCRPGFNGCAFVRAYSELHDDPGVRERARRRKRGLCELILGACRDPGVSDPGALAEQLMLIVEGATTRAFVTGDSHEAVAAARGLARLALSAAREELDAARGTRNGGDDE